MQRENGRLHKRNNFFFTRREGRRERERGALLKEWSGWGLAAEWECYLSCTLNKEPKTFLLILNAATGASAVMTKISANQPCSIVVVFSRPSLLRYIYTYMHNIYCSKVARTSHLTAVHFIARAPLLVIITSASVSVFVFVVPGAGYCQIHRS